MPTPEFGLPLYDGDDTSELDVLLNGQSTVLDAVLRLICPVGTVIAWAGNPTGSGGVPNGWLLCNGQDYSRTAYPKLWQAIGALYGSANSTTFKVPDLRGRMPVGWLPELAQFSFIGQKGGAVEHTLTVSELPPHKHSMDQSGGGNLGFAEAGGSTRYTTGYGAGRANTGIVTADQGGGAPHNNLPPYLVANWLIKF